MSSTNATPAPLVDPPSPLVLEMRKMTAAVCRDKVMSGEGSTKARIAIKKPEQLARLHGMYVGSNYLADDDRNHPSHVDLFVDGASIFAGAFEPHPDTGESVLKFVLHRQQNIIVPASIFTHEILCGKNLKERTTLVTAATLATLRKRRSIPASKL